MRKLRLPAVTMVAALALTGCVMLGGSQTDDTAAEGPAAAPAESAAAGAASEPDPAGTATAGADTEGADVSTSSATAAGLDPANLPDPVATGTVPAVVTGDPAATMDVALYGLHRQDGTVTATYSFTVNSTSEDPDQLYNYLGGAWSTFLVDTVNLNKHDVLSGGASTAQTEDQGSRFAPGQTFYAFAMFAAPPEDITTMDVHVVDGLPAVSGVPIQ